MTQEFNYEADLHIDKSHLDEELMGQAQRMMKYSAAHAQAQYDRDRTKQGLDVTKANLDASIRAELTSSGVKFTEAVVDGKIRTSPSYLEAQEKFMKAGHKVSLLLGAVMAMNARRPMLESLVRMIMSDWWAEPRVKGGEAMKAGAAMNATEEAIVRTTKELGTMISQTTTTPVLKTPTPTRPTPRPVPKV
jgi:hypothetical protein